jgi:hypothetical protein
MTKVINAHFDGKVFVPDEPVELPVGQVLRIQVDLPDGNVGPFADLLRFAADLPGAPSDLAAQHDHYLYGTPKK